MRLTLVISSLDGGGAERVLCVLANCWVDCGHAVTLITLSAEPAFYHLDGRVRRIGVGVDSVSRNLCEALGANTRKLRALRKAIAESRPDIVVSFLDTTNILTILSTAGMHLSVVVSERIDPFHNSELAWIWRTLRGVTYPFAARVIVQTKSVLERMKPMLGEKVTAIPNPVVNPGIRPHAHDVAGGERKWIIGLGRLTPQKGFDMLLNAFAQIASRHTDWSLRILGVGPSYSSLEGQIHDLGLEGRALLLGRVGDPYPLLAESSLFVMSSRFEGFPNALCEAMACGLPVISFDCPSGPSEIIRDGVDGVLIPKEDVSALADAMDRLMGDPKTRASFSLRAPDVTERFGMESVLGQWEQLFAEVRRAS